MAKDKEKEPRAPMDDHQFAMAAREAIGKGTNAEAYDALLDRLPAPDAPKGEGNGE